MDIEKEAPAAPPEQDNIASEAAPPAVPSEDESAGAPAAAQAKQKTERDRLADRGREIAQLRKERDALAQQLTATQQRLSTIEERLALDEQQRLQAYLQSLPPEQRVQEEIRLLREQIGTLQQRLSSAQRAETVEAYKNRRMREILDEVNARYGLDGEDAIRVGDDSLDESGEVAFYASALAEAKYRAKMKSTGGSVAPKKSTNQTSSNIDEVIARVKEETRREILKELGVSSPASARPAGGGGKVTSEDIQKALRGYNSRLGPGAVMKKLRELREQAAEAAS